MLTLDQSSGRMDEMLVLSPFIPNQAENDKRFFSSSITKEGGKVG